LKEKQNYLLKGNGTKKRKFKKGNLFLKSIHKLEDINESRIEYLKRLLALPK